MIVSVILCGLMSIVIFFFVIANNGFSAVSIFYGLFLMFIYGGMTFSENKKKGSGTIYRRFFLTTYAVFFCIGFIANLFAERGSMAITNEALATCELPFCHIVIPQGLLSYLATQTVIFPARVSGHFASIASMLGIWLVFTLVLGRGWCAWVCFYGGWDEGFSRIAKKRRLNLLAHNKEIREFQFGFLFFLVLACFGTMSALYCDWFCPYKIVTEFIPMTTIPGLIAGIIFIGLFLGLVVVLPILTKRRTQCSMLCPFGAFASLTDKLSPFKMRIDTEKCKGCMKCAQACLFGAIDVATIQQKKIRRKLLVQNAENALRFVLKKQSLISLDLIRDAVRLCQKRSLQKEFKNSLRQKICSGLRLLRSGRLCLRLLQLIQLN